MIDLQVKNGRRGKLRSEQVLNRLNDKNQIKLKKDRTGIELALQHEIWGKRGQEISDGKQSRSDWL